MTTRKLIAALPAVALLCAAPVSASFFSPGELAVVTVNDATDDSASAVSINVYDMLTGSFIASHALPSTGDAAFTLSGAIDHDAHLNLSTNGQYLMLAGYGAEVGDPNPVYQSSSDVARVIARIDSDWNVDTSTALSDAYDGTDINAVVSDNGERFWVVGEGKYLADPFSQDPNIDDDLELPTNTGGLRFVSALGDTTSINLSQNQANGENPWPDAYRSARIIDGQLYVNTASHEALGNRGAYITADPLPTAAFDSPQSMIAVITNMEGNETDPGQQLAPDPKGKQVPKTDLVMVDLDFSIPGYDTAYSTGGKDLYDKYCLVFDDASGEFVWQQVSSSSLSNDSDEILALDVIVDDNGDVVLFASTALGIYRLVDDAGYNAAFNLADGGAGYFISAGSGETFRGIAAVPEPGTAALLAFGAVAMLRRRRRNGDTV